MLPDFRWAATLSTWPRDEVPRKRLRTNQPKEVALSRGSTLAKDTVQFSNSHTSLVSPQAYQPTCSFCQMVNENIGALVILTPSVKSGKHSTVAGIVTERGKPLSCSCSAGDVKNAADHPKFHWGQPPLPPPKKTVVCINCSLAQVQF